MYMHCDSHANEQSVMQLVATTGCEDGQNEAGTEIVFTDSDNRTSAVSKTAQLQDFPAEVAVQCTRRLLSHRLVLMLLQLLHRRCCFDLAELGCPHVFVVMTRMLYGKHISAWVIHTCLYYALTFTVWTMCSLSALPTRQCSAIMVIPPFNEMQHEHALPQSSDGAVHAAVCSASPQAMAHLLRMPH